VAGLIAKPEKDAEAFAVTRLVAPVPPAKGGELAEVADVAVAETVPNGLRPPPPPPTARADSGYAAVVAGIREEEGSGGPMKGSPLLSAGIEGGTLPGMDAKAKGREEEEGEIAEGPPCEEGAAAAADIGRADAVAFAGAEWRGWW